MNNFTFFSPTYFVFGKDEENSVGKYVKRFGGTKVLIHYGGGSVVRSGLLDRVKASLTAIGVAFVELGWQGGGHFLSGPYRSLRQRRRRMLGQVRCA